MKVDSMGNHSLVESPDPDFEAEALKLKPKFQVDPIIPGETAVNEDPRRREPTHQKLGNLLDFVHFARKKKAKIEGLRRIRAIRSYEAIVGMEETFVFKGRFHREA